MNERYEKLKTLLKELFQLDQPDLDFGLYRVMHAKSAEVSQFLEKDLLPQVQAAFRQYRSADKTELEEELSKVIAGIEAAGMNPVDSPRVEDLRTQIKSDTVDIGALESEVYDHLFRFFRRYYSEGDFLAKRVYKPGVYALKHPLIFFTRCRTFSCTSCVRPALRRIRRATVAIVLLASWEYVHKACALGETTNECDV